MDKLAVSLSGFAVIGFIIWFFFGKKEKAVVAAGKNINILVNGGYKPNVVAIKAGQPITLTFLRKDENSCLEEIILPDYKIKEYLPIGKPVAITLKPPHPKASEFHCSMNMFHGRIEIDN